MAKEAVISVASSLFPFLIRKFARAKKEKKGEKLLPCCGRAAVGSTHQDRPPL
jgi:hypothetical protein